MTLKKMIEISPEAWEEIAESLIRGGLGDMLLETVMGPGLDCDVLFLTRQPDIIQFPNGAIAERQKERDPDKLLALLRSNLAAIRERDRVIAQYAGEINTLRSRLGETPLPFRVNRLPAPRELLMALLVPPSLPDETPCGAEETGAQLKE